MTTETTEAERVSYNPKAIVAGLAVSGLMLALPAPDGLSPEGWRLAALVALMAIWWVTEAIPVYATGLLPLVGFPLLGIATIGAAAAPYANPIIFLFLGGFLIAAAMQATGLHERIALHVLARTGTGARQLVGGFMLTAAFLSMWVSNTATAVMMVPIAMSVIAITVADDGVHAPRGGLDVALLLAVAYGASIGGIATLIGTPPNAFLAGYMAQEHGLEIGFAQWMMFALPLSLVMLACCWLTLTRLAFRLDGRPIAGVAATLGRALDDLGPIRRPEKTVAVVFALAALAWIAQPLIATVIPNLSDTVIAILAALALFIIPAGGGKPALNWEHAARVPYGLLLLFGGGLSLAAAFGSTGLALWLAGGLGAAAGLPAILVILLIVATIVFLTELTSNIATTAAMVPLLAGVAVGAGIHPLLLCAPAALAASCAFMLPVATPPNAVVFGAGHVTIPQMAKAGFWLNLFAIVVVTAMAYALLGWAFPLVG
ncbi:DASS family sodium-coupled anion symporter [Parvibaculum sp.]|uniref:SLC13 family permease n=1 Tax=Parvibaculum sp. TaxID=2024848 RepID=UPI0025CC094A|nr:DASS family sodium-coupled anion symporter [Parvibaculum sp.]